MTEERVKRKLSAILSADVAGYSRLMGEDEVSTVRTLEAYRKVMADLIEQFRGRVVDSPGDNLLAEFSSVVDAVQCAVEIHDVTRAKNEELPEDRRMLFRIGVNLGDVIEEGDRIYGDGVNIAARLEGLAEPGGVCISGSAHEQIENKLALGYEYLGEHTVKNIAKPVKVYKVPVGPKAVTPKEEKEKKTKLKNWQWTVLGAAGTIIVIIGALAIWNFYLRGESIEPEPVPAMVDVEETKKTIAVLPFENLSSDPEQEYFVDGLCEELLNFLAKIPGLSVTSRTSAFSFKNKDKTVQEIASVLGVGHILEGSVRKAGNTIRVTAQLIRAADDRHLWSDQYDRELKDIEDILSIQEDIAKNVANELKVSLGVEEPLRQIGGTDNLEAYELYLIVKAALREDVPEPVARDSAFEMLQRLIDKAVALDPNYALAWALKASIHNKLTLSVEAAKTVSEQSIALQAVQKAIEIEPNLAEAYATLGDNNAAKGEWIDAEMNYRKAINLSGESSLEAPVYANYLFAVGYIERANEFLKDSLKIDPLNEITRITYILSFGILGNMKQAEEEDDRMRELFGGAGILGDETLYTARLISGDNNYAVEMFEKAKEEFSIVSPQQGITELHRLYVDSENAESWTIINISMWAAYFGDTKLAIDAMERALKSNAAIGRAIWSPVYHEVRQLPRFKEFVREIGLVDYWNKFGWPDICHKLDNDDFVCD